MGRRTLLLLAPLAAGVALTVAAPWAGAAKSTQAGSSAQGAFSTENATMDVGIFQQLNAIRAEHGLSQLVLSSKLSEAAQQHSQDMIDRGYFSHGSSNGQSFGQRLASFYPEGAAHYWAVGENILWSQGVPTAASSMRSWMASPPHRANILDPAWREIGIGAATSSDAPGTFGGRPATVITTDFGVRR